MSTRQEDLEKQLRAVNAAEDEIDMLMDGGLAAYAAALRIAERHTEQLKKELARTQEAWGEYAKGRIRLF